MNDFVGLRSRAASVAFALLLSIGFLCTSTEVLAGNPLSSPKSCGYAGGPACPAPAPIVTPWVYRGTSNALGGATFYSVSELVSYWISWETNPGAPGYGEYCTLTETGQSAPTIEGDAYNVPASESITVYGSGTYWNSYSVSNRAALQTGRPELPRRLRKRVELRQLGGG